MTDIHIGRKTKVLLGLETTFGTKASSFVEISRGDGNEQPKISYAKDENSIGRIETPIKSKILNKWAEPTLNGIVGDLSFGFLLLAALGATAITTDTPDTGSNTHDFTVLNTNAHPSFTIVYIDDVGTKMVTGCRIQSLNMVSEQDFVKFETSWMGKFPVDTTEAFSYVEENCFMPSGRTIKNAADIAGLGGATNVDVDTFNLTIEKNVEAFFGGNIEPKNIVNKQMVMSGNMNLTYENETMRTLFEAGTQQALLFELVNPDVTIGVAANPTVSFQINRANLEDWGKEDGNDDFVMQAFAFVAEYKPEDGAMVTASMINTRATAYDA